MTAVNVTSPIYIGELSKTYRGKRGRRVTALDDVTFSVETGEVFGFLGPNGAGKSTTIKILMGMIRPSSGEASLCGASAGSVASRRDTGYLPENPSFYDFLNACEYLQFVAQIYRMDQKKAKSAIDFWLDRLSLTDAVKRPLRSYSKGMVQRLGLAQALFHDPQVVILDEPMSGLDPQGRALVKEIILELKHMGKTVFFSTHITADVEKICDRLAIIVGGKLRVVTSVEDIRRQGVTGYRVLAHGAKVGEVSNRVSRTETGEFELRVDSSNLGQCVADITAQGGVVQLVEPLRRDLEDYFLEIVNQS